MRKNITFFFLFSVAIASFANGVKIKGIYYLLDDYNFTASVTYGGVNPDSYENSYSGAIVIPDTITRNSSTYVVKRIGEYAFANCSSLTSISIPHTIQTIDNRAFKDCISLDSVLIPNTVDSIGYGVFINCSSLSYISLPDSAFISSDVFENCTSLPIVNGIRYADSHLVEVIDKTLSKYNVKYGTKTIGNYAFHNCSLMHSVQIPNTVFYIGHGAFSSCTNLEGIDFPNSVKTIEAYAFDNCLKIDSIILPNSLNKIEYSAFANCSNLKYIYISQSVSDIGWHICLNCNNLASIIVDDENQVYDSRNYSNAIIKTVSNTLIQGCKNTMIPNTVERIAELSFANCTSLLTLTIPASVTSIGEGAFDGCTFLTSITSLNVNPPVCDEIVSYHSFDGVPRNIPLYVPRVAIPAYQVASQWNEFDIHPLLIDVDSIAPDTTNLTWLPVDSAAIYQLHIYSNQVTLDTTLIILANPNAGGTQLQSAPSPYRQHRIVLDDGVGTLVVVVFDDNSGATSNQPFIVSVSTSSTNRIDLKYDMTILGAANNIIHLEPGSFTLNEGALLYDALDEVSYSPAFVSSSCFDLRGNRYPLSQWSSLPVGIYVIREGGATKKILKTR